MVRYRKGLRNKGQLARNGRGETHTSYLQAHHQMAKHFLRMAGNNVEAELSLFATC